MVVLLFCLVSALFFFQSVSMSSLVFLITFESAPPPAQVASLSIEKAVGSIPSGLKLAIPSFLAVDETLCWPWGVTQSPPPPPPPASPTPPAHMLGVARPLIQLLPSP